MAIVTTGVGRLRMDQLTLGGDGAISASPTNVRVTYEAGDYTDFGGQYTFPNGQIAGTISSITDTVNGKTHYSVTGADADAQRLFALANSGDILGAAAYVLRDDDTITGGAKADTLYGFGGDDSIDGGAGADIIVGGEGRDQLRGGAGADRFTYWSDEDSGPKLADRDTILDFSHAQGDKISLAAIDANEHTTINERFHFVSAFTGAAGELMVREVAGGFLVQGETDGRAGVDFALLVKSADGPLVATDFIL